MYACMHLLSTSSSKSAPGPSVFLTFFFWWPTTRWWWWWWWWWWLWQFFKLFMWNRSLATVSCTFCRPSSKSAPCTSVLNMFKWKSSYRYSPVHFLLTTFPDRPAKPRKQRPSFGDHGSHFTRKKHRVSRPNVFKPEFTCSRPLTLPNYLTTTWWWCGWHADGEKASHYNRL